MSKDALGITAECTFFYLAKFEGDPIPKPDEITPYEALCQDLANPQCAEIVVGGNDIPTQVWRKQWP